MEHDDFPTRDISSSKYRNWIVALEQDAKVLRARIVALECAATETSKQKARLGNVADHLFAVRGLVSRLDDAALAHTERLCKLEESVRLINTKTMGDLEARDKLADCYTTFSTANLEAAHGRAVEQIKEFRDLLTDVYRNAGTIYMRNAQDLADMGTIRDIRSRIEELFKKFGYPLSCEH